MFKKKQCKNCKRKLSKDYDFCPYCGKNLNVNTKINNFNKEDWGMLGKNDVIFPSDLNNLNEIKLPAGLNIIFNSLMKGLDKEFKNLNKEMNDNMKKEFFKKDELNQSLGKTNLGNIRKGGISISISTSGDKPPEIKVNSFGNMPGFKEEEKQIKNKIKKPIKELPKKPLKDFSKLPKSEPETGIRRLSDKVVYEINLPGVESLENVSINQLENSIEIKAISKDKAYQKIIPINLPISTYNLNKGKLILELNAED